MFTMSSFGEDWWLEEEDSEVPSLRLRLEVAFPLEAELIVRFFDSFDITGVPERFGGIEYHKIIIKLNFKKSIVALCKCY